MTEPLNTPRTGMGPGNALSAVDVEKLLDDGDEAKLLGRSETEGLDFKAEPYVLTTDNEKWELAKDVAALANSGGGCLVIGIATTVPADREDEVAFNIKPFPRTLVDAKQYRDALDAKSAVYPVVRDLTIRTFDRPGNSVLMLIMVPEQHPDDQPFLVVRMVEGTEKRGIGIGVPRRSGPHTYWEPPGQLHRDLSDGRRGRRRSAAATGVPSSTASPVSTRVRDLTDRQLIKIEQYMGWIDAPTLLLAAIPQTEQAAPIDGFYDAARISGCVSAPPEIRANGFGLAWARPRNEDGSLVNTSAKRSILWVDPDGACFAAATGAQDFLTRSGGSRTATTPEPRQVNATVIVEWTYLFCLFVTQCVANSVDGNWTLAARLRGARERDWPLRLAPGCSQGFWTEGNEPGMDDWYFETEADLDPAIDAHRLLTAIYSLFGLNQDAIPYTSGGKVDPDTIRAIR